MLARGRTLARMHSATAVVIALIGIPLTLLAADVIRTLSAPPLGPAPRLR